MSLSLSLSLSLPFSPSHLSFGLQLSQFLHQCLNLSAYLFDGLSFLWGQSLSQAASLLQHLLHSLNTTSVQLSISTYMYM